MTGLTGAGRREVKYWLDKGLIMGTDRYVRYLNLFHLDVNEFAGGSVCDYGCGPFGGMLSVLQNLRHVFAIDPLAKTYNGWCRSDVPIRKPERMAVPDAECDAVFCLNVMDHLPGAAFLRNAITRMTKPGGHLYFFAHLNERTDDHYPVTVGQIRRLWGRPPTTPAHAKPTWPEQLAARYWRWEWSRIGMDLVNDDPELRALWGALTRSYHPMP